MPYAALQKIYLYIIDFFWNIYYNIGIGWVWRSLVARMNGVHEAVGSSPITQTRASAFKGACFFYLALCQMLG
jgi:hypothetical protein